MAAVVMMAAELDIQIETGTSTYTSIGGLDTIELGGDGTEADITTKDSDGDDEHVVVRRIRTIKLDGKYLADKTTHAQDAGQAAVQSLADEVFDASLKNFKLLYPQGGGISFKASAKVTSVGGDKDQPMKWTADLKVSGPVSAVSPS